MLNKMENTITIKTNMADFFDSFDNTDGIDESATVSKYYKLAESEIKTLYPDFNVNIVDVGTVSTQIDIYSENDDFGWKLENNMTQEIDHIFDKVFNSDFYVYQ